MSDTKQKVLVMWKDNWADEIDCMGYTIMDNSEWQDLKKEIRKLEEFSISVGSNESIEYENGREFLDNVTEKKISPEELPVLRKFFGLEGGHSDIFDHVRTSIEEREEEEEFDRDLELNQEE